MQKKTDEIKIYPRKASLLAKILELSMLGYTDYAIAEEIKELQKSHDKLKAAGVVTETTVKRDRERLERDYAGIVNYLETVQHVGYFAEKARERFLSLSPQKSEHTRQRIHDLLAQGIALPVGNANRVWDNRLGCYKLAKVKVKIAGKLRETRQVQINQNRVPLAKEFWITYYNGRNMIEFCENNLGGRVNTQHTLKNPIFIGIIKYKGKEYYFPQLAIIDRAMWKECEPREERVRWNPLHHHTFGFIRKAGLWSKDAAVEPKILNVIDLASLGKCRTEIAKLTGLSYDNVMSVLEDPVYANRVLKDGKYEDAGLGFEIVPFEKWLAAHKKYYEKQPRSSFSVEFRQSRMNQRREELRAWIKTHNDLRFNEILHGFLLNDEKPISGPCLAKYLQLLKLENRIEKRNGKWHILSA